MSRYTKVSKADWMKTAVYLSVYVAVLILGTTLLVPTKWPLGFLIWIFAVGGGGLFLLVTWHARNSAYKCPSCQHEFEISDARDFISPNWTSRKYLKCPGCRERVWAELMKKTK